MSLTSVVPTSVPSVRHSSSPVWGVKAENNTVLPTVTNKLGKDNSAAGLG